MEHRRKATRWRAPLATSVRTLVPTTAQFVSRPYIFPNFRDFFLLDSSTINIAHDEFCSLMSTDAPSGLLSSLTSLAWHHTLLLQRGGLAFSEASESHIVAVLVNHWSFATCTPLYSSHFFVLRVCTLSRSYTKSAREKRSDVRFKMCVRHELSGDGESCSAYMRAGNYIFKLELDRSTYYDMIFVHRRNQISSESAYKIFRNTLGSVNEHQGSTHSHSSLFAATTRY